MSNLGEKKIAFIGSGIIAGVFIERLLKAGATSPDRLFCTDVRADRLAQLQLKYGVQVSSRNVDGVRFGDVVFLAVPPNVVLKTLAELQNELREDQLIVSLAAAVPLPAMEQAAGRDCAMIRVIPNTPSLVGAGMNPQSLGRNVRQEQLVFVDKLLALFGETIRIDEELMNIATALTAVGPTYVFPVIKALAEAAAKHGMAEEQALSAAAQVLRGTAQLVLETGRAPDELKQMIGTRTIKEDAVIPVFTEALELAFAKIAESQQKLTGRAQVHASA